MISKQDCYLLLADLQNKGIDTTEILNQIVTTGEITLDVIKFINDNRQLDLTDFYETLRKNYNKKKSSLYINIVKDIENPTEVLTTLAALNLQILLFSKHLENKQMFYRHARASEITAVLNNYYKTFDITNCIKLLRVIKTDLKALESVK